MIKKRKWSGIAALLLAVILAAGGCGKPVAAPESSVAGTSTESPKEENTGASTAQQPGGRETETDAAETSAEETEAESGKETEPSSEEHFEDVSEQVTAEASVRLRQAPSTDSAVLGVLEAGRGALRTGAGETWSRLEVGGMVCYAASRYLRVGAPETAGAPETSKAPESAAPQPTVPVQPPVTGSGRIVAIDPGHQGRGWSELEPIGPGSTVMKAKTTTGTQGCVTGIHESQLNLTVSLKLREALQARGYRVFLVRDSQDVLLSNKDRADMANASGAEIFLRIHANSSANSAQRGVLTMAPTGANPFVAHLSASSISLSQSVVNHISARTGFRNIGVLGSDDMSGINWSRIPVTIVEMGYMSNPDEDRALNTPSVQDQIVQGICDGVDEYFASH